MELPIHDRIQIRMLENGAVDALEFNSKSNGQFRRSISEPRHRLCEVNAGLTRNDELASHFVPKSSCLTSLHGRAELRSA